jgi:hypothetical protein
MGRKKKENNTGYSVNWSFAAVGQRKKKGVRDPDRPKGNSFKYIKKKKKRGTRENAPLRLAAVEATLAVHQKSRPPSPERLGEFSALPASSPVAPCVNQPKPF